MNLFTSLFCLGAILAGSAKFSNPQDNETAQKEFARATMEDANVQTLFDSLKNEQSGRFLNTYASIYFSNLRTNFGWNVKGTCAQVALGMMLSFYDNYCDANFVDTQYEFITVYNHTRSNSQLIDIPSYDCESPGIRQENKALVSNLNEQQYIEYAANHSEENFHLKLVNIAYNCFGTLNLGSYEQTRLVYRYFVFENNYLDNSFGYVDYSSEYDEDQNEIIIQKIKAGHPVIVNAESNLYSGVHAMVAYDYDETTGDIYVHTGWKNTNGQALTHVSLSQLGVTNINYSYSLNTAAIENSYYSDNLDFNYFSDLGPSYTAERFVYPRNVRCIENNGNYTYTFDSLYEEIFFKSLPMGINLEFKNHLGATLFSKRITSGTSYTLGPDEKDILFNSDNYSDYSVTASLACPDNYFATNWSKSTFEKPQIVIESETIKPSDHSLTSVYTTTSSVKNNFVNCETEEGVEFRHRSFRCAKVSNQVVISGNSGLKIRSTPFKVGNVNDDGITDLISRVPITPKLRFNEEGFIEYQMLKPVLSLEIEMSQWGNNGSIKELDYSNGDSCYLEYFYENEYHIHPMGNLLEPSIGLSNNRNNKTSLRFVFDIPVFRFRITARKKIADLTANNEYRVCVGDIKVKFSSKKILPMNGYELHYGDERFVFSEYENCYMYALNTTGFRKPRGNDWMDPGCHDFTNFIQTHCDDMYYYRDENGDPIVMEALMRADQARCHFTIQPIDIDEVCPDGMYKVALYIYGNADYHWIRQNSDGTWSTKMGSEPVENVDFSNMTINDPREADFGNYEYVKCYATTGLPYEGEVDYDAEIPPFSYEELGIIRP